MRVNIYAEEMTERVEIISKEIDGHTFTGLRLYLELPVTLGCDERGRPHNASGPFIHRPGDDDSAAITFWGKRDLRDVLKIMLAKLDAHYGTAPTLPAGVAEGWKRVPDEPTEDMIFAGLFELDDDFKSWDKLELVAIYQAMLAASPAPASQKESGHE